MQEAQTAMMTREEGKGRFNYRVVGIALHGDQVLLHRAENDDFWSLPGGRVHLLEPSEEALKREIREELGVEIQVERLVWVVENFFEYNDIAYHEFALYFLMMFPSDSCLYEQDEPFAGNEEGVRLIFKWHQRDELEGLPLYPSFLRRALNAIPEVPELVHSRNAL
jgi:ADP-ribose pyrophosphatase YjhB (NUDIX family)